MIDWSQLIGKLVSMLMSWLQAGNLRNRMYVLQEENEIMRVALDDITRMDPEGRMGWYAKCTLDQLEGRE
jgi:predicted KAP-like P-loop ATPase